MAESVGAYGKIPLRYKGKPGDPGYKESPSWVVGTQRRYFEHDPQYDETLMWVDTDDQAQDVMRAFNRGGQFVEIAFGLVGKQQMEWLRGAVERSMGEPLQAVKAEVAVLQERLVALEKSMTDIVGVVQSILQRANGQAPEKPRGKRGGDSGDDPNRQPGA